MILCHKSRFSLPFRGTAFVIIFTFVLSSVTLPEKAQAQGVSIAGVNLPALGTMISPSVAYVPPIMAGMTIHPENPLQFDFIIDTGDDNLKGAAFRQESQKLINYFLAALTVPENEMWVNLSPYEKDRIIADGLSQTEMGRDMLAQDYLLKQLTASLMYPEEELGSKFWNRVYEQAQEKYGITDIPTSTFNKVWIVPDEATVYVNGTNVFVSESHLRVMLEEDYLATVDTTTQRHQTQRTTQDGQDTSLGVDSSGVLPRLPARQAGAVGSWGPGVKEIIKDLIIPEIEREVNHGKNFANLRQIYHSMILATWYKQNLKDSVLGKVYVDANKVQGIDLKDKAVKDKLYSRYIAAFKQGVYDYIKEDYDPMTQQIIPRKYFSGGLKNIESVRVGDLAMGAIIRRKQAERVTVDLAMAEADAVVTISESREFILKQVTVLKEAIESGADPEGLEIAERLPPYASDDYQQTKKQLKADLTNQSDYPYMRELIFLAHWILLAGLTQVDARLLDDEIFDRLAEAIGLANDHIALLQDGRKPYSLASIFALSIAHYIESDERFLALSNQLHHLPEEIRFDAVALQLLNQANHIRNREKFIKGEEVDFDVILSHLEFGFQALRSGEVSEESKENMRFAIVSALVAMSPYIQDARGQIVAKFSSAETRARINGAIGKIRTMIRGLDPLMIAELFEWIERARIKEKDSDYPVSNLHVVLPLSLYDNSGHGANFFNPLDQILFNANHSGMRGDLKRITETNNRYLEVNWYQKPEIFWSHRELDRLFDETVEAVRQIVEEAGEVSDMAMNTLERTALLATAAVVMPAVAQAQTLDRSNLPDVSEYVSGIRTIDMETVQLLKNEFGVWMDVMETDSIFGPLLNAQTYDEFKRVKDAQDLGEGRSYADLDIPDSRFDEFIASVEQTDPSPERSDHIRDALITIRDSSDRWFRNYFAFQTAAVVYSEQAGIGLARNDTTFYGPGMDGQIEQHEEGILEVLVHETEHHSWPAGSVFSGVSEVLAGVHAQLFLSDLSGTQEQILLIILSREIDSVDHWSDRVDVNREANYKFHNVPADVRNRLDSLANERAELQKRKLHYQGVIGAAYSIAIHHRFMITSEDSGDMIYGRDPTLNATTAEDYFGLAIAYAPTEEDRDNFLRFVDENAEWFLSDPELVETLTFIINANADLMPNAVRILGELESPQQEQITAYYDQQIADVLAREDQRQGELRQSARTRLSREARAEIDALREERDVMIERSRLMAEALTDQDGDAAMGADTSEVVTGKRESGGAVKQFMSQLPDDQWKEEVEVRESGKKVRRIFTLGSDTIIVSYLMNNDSKQIYRYEIRFDHQVKGRSGVFTRPFELIWKHGHRHGKQFEIKVSGKEPAMTTLEASISWEIQDSLLGMVWNDKKQELTFIMEDSVYINIPKAMRKGRFEGKPFSYRFVSQSESQGKSIKLEFHEGEIALSLIEVISPGFRRNLRMPMTMQYAQEYLREAAHILLSEQHSRKAELAEVLRYYFSDDMSDEEMLAQALDIIEDKIDDAQRKWERFERELSMAFKLDDMMDEIEEGLVAVWDSIDLTQEPGVQSLSEERAEKAFRESIDRLVRVKGDVDPGELLEAIDDQMASLRTMTTPAGRLSSLASLEMLIAKHLEITVKRSFSIRLGGDSSYAGLYEVDGVKLREILDSLYQKLKPDQRGSIFTSEKDLQPGFRLIINDEIIDPGTKDLPVPSNARIMILKVDEAMSAPGGIDFNPENLNLKQKGKVLGFELDNSMLQHIQPNTVLGIQPVIINIAPITNFAPLLGLNESEGHPQLSQI